MPKIFLHSCCAPCTIYVHQKLITDGFEVNSFFYNPNIRPRAEYEIRRQTMDQYARAVGLKVLFEPNDRKTEPGSCENCYLVRLNKTAAKAKELGFDYYSTTLLISPYQKHELLKEIGQKVGKEHGIEFYYEDFRAGFRPGQAIAREMDLYRQKYCGCGIELAVRKEPEYASIN